MKEFRINAPNLLNYTYFVNLGTDSVLIMGSTESKIKIVNDITINLVKTP